MIEPELILEGLGGSDNVQELEPCITRLRVEVVDPERVDEAKLKSIGAFGVVQVGNTVQVVVGPVADELAGRIQSLV